MTDEDVLRSVFAAAARDLRAPEVQLRPRPTVVALQHRRAAPVRNWPHRALIVGVAAAAGAVTAAVAILGFGAGTTTEVRLVPSTGRAPAATPGTGSVPGGPTALYRLASAVRAMPAPTGRYAVQVERQTEGTTSYLKATIIDSRTGDTWTYQDGPNIPAVLPMAPGFSPTEAQLQSSDPTAPAQLRAALVAQASAANPRPAAPQTANDLAVTQAIDTLWNPLVQPALRAALVSVIAASPGVRVDPHATDPRGRKALEIDYADTAVGMRLSVDVDPSTGVVLASSQQPTSPTGDPTFAGSDVYLSQYWTDASPTVDPLQH